MKSFAFLLVILPLLGSCIAPIVPFVAATAVGIWTHDEYSKNSGSIPVEAPAQDVWAAAKAVAADHAKPGEDLDVSDGVMRIEGRLLDANVLISILPYPSTDKIVEIKVMALQGFKGRQDIAKILAEEIQARL
jgi:hypothetical protein